MAGETNAKAGAPAMAAAAAEPAKRAYVTILASNDRDRLEAVVRLAKSLRQVGVAYPLVVALLPDVPEEHRRILVSHGCFVREIQPVYPPENPAQFYMAAPLYVANYSMLRIWEFEDYERMVYLDADIKVLKNIDALFELDKGYFYAAELRSPPAPYLNAGFMFVHEPSLATAEALLLDMLRATTPESVMNPTGFLNTFFMDQYKRIPLEFNSLVRAPIVMAHPYQELQLVDGAKRPWTLLKLFATKAAALARQNPPAMATLAASVATLGVVTTGASSPVISFGFYAGFIGAIATVMVSILRI